MLCGFDWATCSLCLPEALNIWMEEIFSQVIAGRTGLIMKINYGFISKLSRNCGLQSMKVIVAHKQTYSALKTWQRTHVISGKPIVGYHGVAYVSFFTTTKLSLKKVSWYECVCFIIWKLFMWDEDFRIKAIRCFQKCFRYWTLTLLNWY